MDSAFKNHSPKSYNCNLDPAQAIDLTPLPCTPELTHRYLIFAGFIATYNQIYTGMVNKTGYANSLPNWNYSSPELHHVTLTGLTPDTTYYYKVTAVLWVDIIQTNTLAESITPTNISHIGFAPCNADQRVACTLVLLQVCDYGKQQVLPRTRGGDLYHQA